MNDKLTATEYSIEIEEEIWSGAFFSGLASGFTAGSSVQRADEALALYKKRWPKSTRTPGGSGYAASGSGLSSRVMTRVCEQLKADTRWDALLVVESLFEAIKAGESLKWSPPPRGGRQ
jgi:hypothetical protein